MHVHRYEKIWLMLGGATLIAFMIILSINAFAMGATPPSDMQMIDATKVDKTPPFDKPGLKQIGDKEYDANMTAYTFGYSPSTLEVPAGSTVHFHVTTKDVVHGFEIPGTDVNMMLTPGFVNSSSHTFTTPGTYLILCNEYCGAAHQMMMAHVVVK